ncbi:MAG TPA: DUF6781 family protein [Usitatibacter sp.]|nr:DUF6781 family protein [Usitatibacter sp.]
MRSPGHPRRGPRGDRGRRAGRRDQSHANAPGDVGGAPRSRPGLARFHGSKPRGLRDLTAAGRSFSDQDLKAALANLRKVEGDFLATVGQVADAANAKVAPELREALRAATKTGTATGREVALAMGDFAQKFTAASFDAALVGLETATEFGQRFSMVASGVLAGLAEALRTPKDEKGSGKTGSG